MNSSRSAASPGYKIAMEELAKLLHDTGSCIERIICSLSAASMQPKLLDVRTSLSIGITPSTQGNRGDTSHMEAHNLPHIGDAWGSAFRPQTAASKVAHHQHDVQNWFAQAHRNMAGQGKMSFGWNALAANDEGTISSDENALKAFLEEMKKTIGNWLARQKVLVQDKAGSVNLPNGALLSSGFSKEQSPVANTKAMGSHGGKEVLLHENEKVEKTDSVLPHQDKEAGQSCSPNKNVDDIARQLLQSGDEDTRANDLQRIPLANTQSPSKKDKAAQSPRVADVGGEQGSTSQAATLAAEGNAASTPTLEEVNPTTDGFITPTNTDQVEVLPLTKWKPPTSAAKKKDKNLSISHAVEIISSPDWLPEGWITELKTRGSGNSAGTKDKYYIDPVSNRRFRSRKEVIAYLEYGKPKLSDSPPPSPIKKLLTPEPVSSVPKKSHKKAKAKESSKPSPSRLPPPMVPSIASPGLIGSTFMPPIRTGQPSEWLLYESLASLPFSMFDPLYYTDMGANKSSSSKSSQIPTRPWFFSGPEASWSPFMDRSKSGDKGRDYHSFYSTPLYASDAVPKPSSAGSGKKPVKRKSADS